MHLMRRNRLWKWAALVTMSSVPAILPFSCTQPILRFATPFLLDGSNGFLVTVLKAVAPFLLP